MCDGEVDFHEIEERWRIEFDDHFAPELARLAGDDFTELVEIDRERRRIAALPTGRFMLRNLARVFDGYQKSAGQRRFSLSL